MIDDDSVSNPSKNESFQEVVAARLSRRSFLGGSAAAATLALGGIGSLVRALPAQAHGSEAELGFTGIAVSAADAVVVPEGYTARVLIAWGDPISTGTRVQAGREQHRGRAGAPVGHAQRRRRVLSHRRLAPRAARAEPRVHGRRAAVPGRRRELDGGKDQQGPQRARRVGHRDPEGSGARQRRRVARGAPIKIRPAHHRPDTDPDRRARRRRPAVADERGSFRSARARDAEQLRHGLHAVGHLPGVRGELQRILPENPRGPDPAGAAVRHRSLRLGLSVSHHAPAVQRRPRAQRAQPLRLGGGDRSLQVPLDAGEAHRAGPHQARGGVGAGDKGRSHRRVHGR